MLLMDGLEVLNSKPCSALCAGAVVLPVPHFDDMGHGNEGEEAAQVASPRRAARCRQRRHWTSDELLDGCRGPPPQLQCIVQSVKVELRCRSAHIVDRLCHGGRRAAVELLAFQLNRRGFRQCTALA